MEAMREKLARLCRMAYAKDLLDSAGGNVSARTPEGVLASARYAGSQRQWQLNPEDFLLLDLAGNQLSGEGEVSRETKMHLTLYQAFPQAGAVIHSHSKNIQVFVATETPLPPMTEQTDKYGTIGFTPAVPQHSQALADAAVEALKPKEALIPKHAIAVLFPRHGSCIVGADLEAAYDALERLDRSAYYALGASLLGKG